MTFLEALAGLLLIALSLIGVWIAALWFEHKLTDGEDDDHIWPHY